MRITPSLIPFTREAPFMVLSYSHTLRDWIPDRHKSPRHAWADYQAKKALGPCALTHRGVIVAHNARPRERDPVRQFALCA